MTRRRDVHVIGNRVRSGWQVTQGGRTLSNHRTQETALTAARRVARRHRVDLVTHGQRGQAAGLAPLFAFSVVRLPSSAVILLDDEDVDCARVNVSYE